MAQEENSTGRNGLIGKIQEFNFNISDWTIYKARLDNYFEANNITGVKRRAIFLNMLDEDSYRLMFDQCSPVKPEQKSYEQLLEIFDKHFAPVHTPFAERIKFYESERGPEESPNEWVARVRRLAIQCEFDNHLETVLRDKFICGFGKGLVLDRLLEEKITIYLADAVKIANHKMAALSSFGCKNGQGQDGQQDENPVKQEVTQTTEASSASSELGCAARPLPDAIRDLVEQEINRLVDVGILTPVSFSEWATPVVPIIKKNGDIRLCADFKVTINPHIQVDQYPIPRIEDLFGRLQGREQFTKLELSQAYQQIAVDEPSKSS
ncbi:uncharacterized protein LOC123317833 [Coccinella septempunctata]|uniref:uncharacterized protein LOC123317833 n=1 Tax=Coccinella septempunctata TaxID=41139 RepID=UPI001D0861A7|nr:uncharacterized protein LOC123317833 [Coccinella septempunctata]